MMTCRLWRWREETWWRDRCVTQEAQSRAEPSNGSWDKMQCSRGRFASQASLPASLPGLSVSEAGRRNGQFGLSVISSRLRSQCLTGCRLLGQTVVLCA